MKPPFLNKEAKETHFDYHRNYLEDYNRGLIGSDWGYPGL